MGDSPFAAQQLEGCEPLDGWGGASEGVQAALRERMIIRNAQAKQHPIQPHVTHPTHVLSHQR